MSKLRFGPIDGVEVWQPKVFVDSRGQVRHFAKPNDLWYQGGEVYFSFVNPGVIKAWHLHKRMTLNYACIHGDIMVGLVDGRPGSQTKDNANILRLEAGNPDNWMVVRIPPGVWNGFRCFPSRHYHHSVVVNFGSEPHDPDEIVRASIKELYRDFPWGDHETSG
jgi:dTDP-4-dehydrorhamnose 3,5-epimerase